MKIVIFFSYSRQDNEIFHVPRIAQELENYPEVKEVLFYEGVEYANIVKYMNDNINKCNIFLLFCSQNALNSRYIEDEWQAAYSEHKIIIPIFQNFDHVPSLLTSRLGVQFRRDNIKQSIIDIYNTIIKAYSAPKEALKEALESRKFEYLARFKLDWSHYFNEEIIKQIGFKDYEDIKEFLRNPDQWKDTIDLISQLEMGDEWFKDAFFSIQSGSKGLFQAQYLDHALISVPPPLNLLEQIVDNLNSYSILGVEAPAGWGKSRMILWVALSFALQNKTTYYFPDPIELNEDMHISSIQALLKQNDKVIVVDDFHLRNNSSKEISFWRNCFYLARKNHNQILFTLTKVQESKETLFSPYNFRVISSNEYTHYWQSQWVERFKVWFNDLKSTILKQYIAFERLDLANKADSPWGFVSILVNLRDLITKQLSIKSNASLIIIFTVFIWGFAVSEERGISARGIYNALIWLKNNSLKHWRDLEATGGTLWDFINIDDEYNFLKRLMQQIEKWRQSPRDLTEIRLLPSEGLEVGPSLPIKSHHVAWWDYALNVIWENEWKDFTSLKQICKLIILHSSTSVHDRWISIDDSCKELEDCSQIEILTLEKGMISDIRSFESLTSLRTLTIVESKISDIKPLASLKNLQTLSLLSTPLLDINPLVSLKNLQGLHIIDMPISDVSPIASLTKLQKLTISMIKISDIRSLAALRNLQGLELSLTQVSDIRPLTSLTNLNRLYLTATKVSDISPVAQLTSLQRLDIEETEVSDLNALKLLINLEELNVSRTKVSDLTPLASLKNLQELFLNNTKVSDISPLASLNKLQWLLIYETDISDISPLASLNNLHWLDISETKVSDISALSSLDNLQDLNLTGTKVSNISSLASLKNLKQLQLPYNFDFSTIPNSSPLASLTKQNLEFWLKRGEGLYISEKYNDAIESNDKALEIDPENLTAWEGNASSFFKLHKYVEAELCYNKILELNINRGRAWYYKGCIESIRKNKEKAIEFLRKAIENDNFYFKLAKKDEYFENIRDSQEFKDLIGE